MVKQAFRRELAFLLFCPVCLFSQTDTLTVDEAVSRALRDNESVKSADLSVQQSLQHVEAVRSTRFPTLLFHTHYLHTPESGYNEAVTNGGEYGLQLTAGVQIYDGGIRSATIDQSLHLAERSRVARDKTGRDIAFNVRALCFEALQNEADARLRREAVGRLEDYAVLLRQLRAGGNATEGDVLKARVDLNNARIAVDVAGQAYGKSMLLLKNLLRLPYQVELTIVAPDNDTDSVQAGDFSAAGTAEMKLLELERRSAELDLSIARAGRLPTITIAGDAGVLGVTPRDFNEDAGYSLLLTLDVPVLDWGAAGSRIGERELAVAQLATERTRQERELETEWRITLRDLESARMNMIHYGENIGVAEQNYVSAKSRFAGGAGSTLDVLDAQRLLSETKQNYNNALFQMRLDRAILLRLSGHQ